MAPRGAGGVSRRVSRGSRRAWSPAVHGWCAGSGAGVPPVRAAGCGRRVRCGRDAPHRRSRSPFAHVKISAYAVAPRGRAPEPARRRSGHPAVGGRRPGAGRPRRRTGLAAARPGLGGHLAAARRRRGRPPGSRGVPAGLRRRSSDCRARMPVSKPLKRFVLITYGGAGMAFRGLNLAAGRSARRGCRGGRANRMVGSRPFRGRRTPLPERFFPPSGTPGGARPGPPAAFWPGKSQFTGRDSGVGTVAGGRKTVQPVWY